MLNKYTEVNMAYKIKIDSHPRLKGRNTCTLLAFVDDATSRLMQLRFVASESAFDYLRATRAYLEAHGKPVAFYSDKHGIFRVNAARMGT
jgi:hypothetical protein